MPEQEVRPVGERLRFTSARIASYLAARQSPSGAFPARNFYGKGFAALLWLMHGGRYRANADQALDGLGREARGVLPGNYHHEFNRYALLKIAQLDAAAGPLVRELLARERYTGTRVANWTLLRAYGRLHSPSFPSRVLARAELLAIRYLFTRDSGLIEDQRGAYTMQYHAFCCALLGELAAGPLAKSKSHRAWFERSVDALVALILPGGQCNYLGRGALQSFGYAAAVLALAHAYREFGRDEHRAALDEVHAFIARHQRADGSLPLVLSGADEGAPERFDLLNPAYAGWWSYNNYYDYLPFTGALLALAARVVDGARDAGSRPNRAPRRTDARFDTPIRVIRAPKYTAVYTLPHARVWSACLPLPYFETRGRYPFPCYGGEQHQASIYSKFGLPLPVVGTARAGEIAFVDAHYAWDGEHGFRGELNGVMHRRCFTFGDAAVEVVDLVAWNDAIDVTALRVPRLLLAPSATVDNAGAVVSADGVRIEFDTPVREEEQVFYSPNGALKCFVVQIDPVALRARRDFTCRYTIRFAGSA